MRTWAVIVATSLLTAVSMKALESVPVEAHEENGLVTAREFRLEDRFGRVVSSWYVDEFGSPALAMTDGLDTGVEDYSVLSGFGLAAEDSSGNQAFYLAGPKRRALTFIKPNGRVRYRK